LNDIIPISTTARLALALVALVAGCAVDAPERRPIEELYGEALAAARVRSDPAEAAAHEVGPSPNLACPVRSGWAPSPTTAPKGPRVSDMFVEADIRQAIQALALQAGVPVLVDELIRGMVTATIEDEPLERALTSLVLPLGYIVGERDGRFLVGAPVPESSLFPYLANLYEFRPRHVAGSELVHLLSPQAAAFVKVSPREDLIVIRAPAEVAATLLADLERFDTPTPQVVLEAIVCSYAPNERLDFGFDFDAGFEAGGAGQFVNAGLKSLSGNATFGPAGLPDLKSFEFASVYLRALQREGYVSVRAAPRVMAEDGKRAVITIGAETYFTVGDGNNVFRDLKPVQTGIILDIVPRIRGSQVTVEITRAEVSDELRPAQVIATTPDDHLPTIDTRRVSTTVHVRDGETIVIGGLVSRRRVERTVKIPLLGDIPLLGLLFQRIDSRDEEVEVAIFISPRIVRSPQ